MVNVCVCSLEMGEMEITHGYLCMSSCEFCSQRLQSVLMHTWIFVIIVFEACVRGWHAWPQGAEGQTLIIRYRGATGLSPLVGGRLLWWGYRERERLGALPIPMMVGRRESSSGNPPWGALLLIQPAVVPALISQSNFNETLIEVLISPKEAILWLQMPPWPDFWLQKTVCLSIYSISTVAICLSQSVYKKKKWTWTLDVYEAEPPHIRFICFRTNLNVFLSSDTDMIVTKNLTTSGGSCILTNFNF